MVICISGKAQVGKDYISHIIKERLEENGNSVKIMHYADLLKYICKTFFDWNGKKDIEGRHTLQFVGTDTIRKENPNYWVDFIKDILRFFPNEWDYVLIPDTRFPNEIEEIKKEFNCISVRIERPDAWENSLTDEQKNHESETALDDYIFNYKILNTGDETVNNEVDKFINSLLGRSDANESEN